MGVVTPEILGSWIDELEAAPGLVRKAVEGLSQGRLDTPYREGGWTPRQIVHHIADSNMNMYIRYKLALTEDMPVIKPYNETLWSKLHDAKNASVEDSLVLLDGLHSRWVCLLRNMSMNAFKRVFVHPDSGSIQLDRGIGIYSWHTKHHTAQITEMRKRNNW